jgi:hypothetical protein
MPAQKASPVRQFSTPVPLTDTWLEEHKSHSIGWSTHTVFKGKRGTQYKECRCYICQSVAQEKIGEVKAVVQKAPKTESKRRTRRTNEPVIYPKGWTK